MVLGFFFPFLLFFAFSLLFPSSTLSTYCHPPMAIPTPFTFIYILVYAIAFPGHLPLDPGRLIIPVGFGIHGYVFIFWTDMYRYQTAWAWYWILAQMELFIEDFFSNSFCFSLFLFPILSITYLLTYILPIYLPSKHLACSIRLYLVGR